MTQTAAAARLRTLSTCSQTADWYAQRPTQVPAMRNRSAVSPVVPNYNSIGFGAAKQGAPPRGVPR